MTEAKGEYVESKTHSVGLINFQWVVSSFGGEGEPVIAGLWRVAGVFVTVQEKLLSVPSPFD